MKLPLMLLAHAVYLLAAEPPVVALWVAVPRAQKALPPKNL
ncbi:MAG: hypothetical protein WKF37_17795 [Bryobacteraceae bacterium]